MTTPPRSLPSARPSSRSRTDELEAVLRDIRRHGGDLRRGEPPRSSAGVCASGLETLDAQLGGGFVRGSLSEVAGPPTSGRTSLVHQLLAHTTKAGELAALVDVPDDFDPTSAEAAGVDLSRLLWVRAPGVREGLRSAEQILSARGFALILLDLGSRAQEVGARVWPRLRKTTAASESAFLVLGDSRVVHTFADLGLELEAARPRFEALHRSCAETTESTADPAFTWLRGLESVVHIARHRRGPDGGRWVVQWATGEVRPLGSEESGPRLVASRRSLTAAA